MHPDSDDKAFARNEALSDRLICLLRERVAQFRPHELVKYLDDLLPLYEMPGDTACRLDDRRLVYQTAELLQYRDVQFVKLCYQCIFKRRVDELGLQSGLQVLQIDGGSYVSRIQLLGRLRYSQEGKERGVEVRGLWFRYFLARLRQVPVFGRVAALFLKLDQLARLDLELVQQNADVVRGARNRGVVETAVSDHYSEVDRRLGTPISGSLDAKAELENRINPASSRSPTLAEINSFSGAEFVQRIYQIVLGREPSGSECETAMVHLGSGSKSRIVLLGDLYRSAESPGNRGDIIGLRPAYLSEVLLSIPVLGFILQLPRAFRMLSRIDSVLDYQSAEIADNIRKISEAEMRMMTHYNNTLMQLKRELVDALRDDGTER